MPSVFRFITCSLLKKPRKYVPFTCAVRKLTIVEGNAYNICWYLGDYLLRKDIVDPTGKIPNTIRLVDCILGNKSSIDTIALAAAVPVVNYNYDSLMRGTVRADLTVNGTFYVTAVDYAAPRAVVPNWIDNYPQNITTGDWKREFDTLSFQKGNYSIGSTPYAPVFGIIAMSSEVSRDFAQVANLLGMYASPPTGGIAFGTSGVLFMCTGGTWDGVLTNNRPTGSGATDAAKTRLANVMVKPELIVESEINDVLLSTELVEAQAKKLWGKITAIIR